MIKTILKRIRDLCLVGVVTVVLMEIVLRIYNPIYVPLRADEIQLPVNRVFKGHNPHNKKVDEYRVNRYNGIGLRGPEYPAQPENYIKIFTVGGSTTACVTLTDGRTWPDVLARNLTGAGGKQIWLNNAGADGHSTFGHKIMLEHHLSKFEPDYVVYLVGINDVGRDDLNDYDVSMTKQGLSLRNKIVAASELLATLQVLYRTWRAYDSGLNNYTDLDLTKQPRVVKSEAERAAILQMHPSKYVPGYRARLEELIAVTRAAGAEPVLVTQPGLMGRGIDPTTGVEISDLDYFEGMPAALEWDILELYNDVTRQVAAQHNVTLIDAAREMPKDSNLYFDWIHYSNAGAERMAEIIRAGLQPRISGTPPVISDTPPVISDTPPVTTTSL